MSTPRPAALVPICGLVLELLGRLLDEDVVIRSMPEGWVLCRPNGCHRTLIVGTTVDLLVMYGLLTADRTQPAATYHLNDTGRRAFYAGAYEPCPVPAPTKGPAR